MANAFDQFDAPVAAPASNAFDQFDQPGYTSQFFPVSVNGNGHYSLAVPGLLQRAYSAATAPGDVLTGKAQTPYSPGATSTQPSPDLLNRATDFASFFGPQSAALRAGEMIPGELASRSAPSAQELKNVAGAGYDAARASGATVPGQDIADAARQVQQTLQGDHGIIAKTAPKTYAILDELANPPAGAVGTYTGLEAARRGLGAISGEAGTEGLAGRTAVRGLDPLIDSMAPDAAAARANYAAAQRSNDLTGTLDRANTGILERAETRAQASNSGRNIDNAIRQRVASLLEKPSEVSGFSDPEIEALKSIVAGGPAQNTARFVGNLLGGGGGLAHMLTGAMGGAGAAHLGGGLLETALGAAIPPAIGYGAKTLENTLAQRALGRADEMTRMRSPLADSLLSAGGLWAPSTSRNQAVVRALLPGLLSPPAPAQPATPGLLDFLARGGA